MAWQKRRPAGWIVSVSGFLAARRFHGSTTSRCEMDKQRDVKAWRSVLGG